MGKAQELSRSITRAEEEALEMNGLLAEMV